MKTTILTIALGLAALPLTFAQTPAPAAPTTDKPAATATAKTRKHSKKAVKKTVKTPAVSATPAPVKQ
jgi:hypothetical protein